MSGKSALRTCFSRVDDALGDGVLREFTLRIQFPGNRVVDPGFDNQFGERQRVEVAHVGRGVGLHVDVEQVTLRRASFPVS